MKKACQYLRFNMLLYYTLYNVLYCSLHCIVQSSSCIMNQNILRASIDIGKHKGMIFINFKKTLWRPDRILKQPEFQNLNVDILI